MKRILPFLLCVIGLSGCKTTDHSAIQPTNLDSIGTSVAAASGEIDKSTALAKKIYAEGAKKNDKQVKLLQDYLVAAQLELSKAQAEIKNKQTEINNITVEMNKVVDRLNYLEPKYAAAVGQLWKWRLIVIGMGLFMAGYAYLKWGLHVFFL